MTMHRMLCRYGPHRPGDLVEGLTAEDLQVLGVMVEEVDPPDPDPDSDPTRGERLVRGVGRLNPLVPAHWTKAGMPTVEALEVAAGLQEVSAAERDAAWAAFLADDSQED